jgi:uncharacterized protein with von Willebrand factor type A (vWA) domain
MTGEGIAAVITSLAGFATSVGTVILQLRQAKISASNADKIDANTAITQSTANKLEEVHAATAAIAESTGTHRTLSDGG